MRTDLPRDTDPAPQVPRPACDPLFQVHRLNEDGLKKAEEIAAAFNDCLYRLQGVCSGNREFAIVKTKLEEAAFFAKKSMANHPHNQL
jgi:hypothetical protein